MRSEARNTEALDPDGVVAHLVGGERGIRTPEAIRERGREYPHRIVAWQQLQVWLDRDEVASAVLSHDRAEAAVLRADVVGEQPEEKVAVHLAEVAVERRRGEPGVLPRVVRIGSRDPEP